MAIIISEGVIKDPKVWKWHISHRKKLEVMLIAYELKKHSSDLMFILNPPFVLFFVPNNNRNLEMNFMKFHAIESWQAQNFIQIIN